MQNRALENQYFGFVYCQNSVRFATTVDNCRFITNQNGGHLVVIGTGVERLPSMEETEKIPLSKVTS